MLSLPLSAFLIGIWSSAHCLAMCGGIAIAAGQANRQNLNNTSAQRGVQLAFWQLGRVMSYALMGFIAGGFGAFFLGLTPLALIRDAAFIAANLLLIALGMHVAKLWSGIVAIERVGTSLWKFMSPLASATLLPPPPQQRSRARQIVHAIRAGAIWGWLPCGLVYSMLITASVTGSATQAGLWMAAFGLGTVSALWLASMASSQATSVIKRPAIRKAAGLAIVGFGLWGLLRATGVMSVTWLDAFCIGGSHLQQL